jgi:ribosomal protein S15P/S13E
MLNENIPNQSFDSGAVRGSQNGKGRYDLISTYATRRLAQVLERGASRYGDRNWEKGIPLMRHISSLKRHLDEFIEDHTNEDHLAHMFANAMMLVHTEEMIRKGALPKHLDDRPKYNFTERTLRECTDCD